MAGVLLKCNFFILYVGKLSVPHKRVVGGSSVQGKEWKELLMGWGGLQSVKLRCYFMLRVSKVKKGVLAV